MAASNLYSSLVIPRTLACKASVSARVLRQSCDESQKKKFAPEFNYKTLLRRLQADLYYTLTEFYADFEINLSWCVHVVFVPMAKKEYQNNKVHSTFNACVIYSGFSVKTNLIFSKKVEGMPTKILARDGIERDRTNTCGSACYAGQLTIFFNKMYIKNE